jgi:hypothetical protein
MNRHSALAATAAAVLILSGCASLAPSAVGKLAGFDPLSADPASVAVAVRTDRRLWLRTGDVVLRIALEAEDGGTGFDESFELMVSPDGGDAVAGLAADDDEHVLVARVAPADRARLAETQAKARAARGKGRGTFEVAVKGGCRTGAIDPGVAASTYLRTGADETFFALTRNVRLARAIGADAVAAIPDCGGGMR